MFELSENRGDVWDFFWDTHENKIQLMDVNGVEQRWILANDG